MSLNLSYEFHVSRWARQRYQFDEELFGLTGNVVFADFHAARTFAQKMNARRDLVNYPEQAVRAGQINALGLIDEILHLLVRQYRQGTSPKVMQQALDWLEGMLGVEVMQATLRQFVDEFPPVRVYRREISAEEWLEGSSEDMPNRQIALEEMLMLWLANNNPAFEPFRELFDDRRLAQLTSYNQIFSLLHAFFETQATFGVENVNLIDLLRSPALKEPTSLAAQLDYLVGRWGNLLGKYLYYRMLSSLDMIKEEEKPVFLGPGPAEAPDFTHLQFDTENFSPDLDWMPSLVLLAKNTYVWLDQLSKQYHRPITRLADIPDEELDKLRGWGFTGLWLIGLWERSAASQRIKILRGNPEAVASAYSLYDYSIASELGGEEAFQDLRQRAWKRGIRLSADMVPNHMGIDSRWVIEHPDWFIALDYSPYPAYSFNGPNLSGNDRVGIYLEDHYYNNSDAAVVFKRVDFWTGQEKYIYHGNDGTSYPWNDTAQLNFLLPEVREAIIQTILHVARKFHVIRFDAAMTLAKKHYQRLWFPEPGTGGDIPSRAEHGLRREQFEAAIPVEFWRELVDRVAQEVPDTLLLAEAFWLMEGYFVRTLGMHRVYNSAFMNMLRDEKNAEYRLVIKNTLEFDPEVLKRYVNFMNNPDEKTAVEQFGKGDKYFGICILMATLPGLPMFGHGQVEGFTEKYGMEYRKAYWEETPDESLVERHAREIFPLLRKRYLFAEVRDFLLFDFFTPEGYVNENVFVYTNRSGGERALVIYNNKYATARGWIRTSAAYSARLENGERQLQQRTLAEGLGLEAGEGWFTIFHDQANDLEYIRANDELLEKGFYTELEAYKFQVFTEIYTVKDNEFHQFAQLASYLGGRGVPDIEEAVKEIFLQPIHQEFREITNAGFFRWVISNRVMSDTPASIVIQSYQAVLDEAEKKVFNLLLEIKRLTRSEGEVHETSTAISKELVAILHIPSLPERYRELIVPGYQEALDYLMLWLDEPSPWSAGEARLWGTILGWMIVRRLGEVVNGKQATEISRSWIDEWLLGKILLSTLGDLGVDERSANKAVSLIKVLCTYPDWWKDVEPGEAAGSLLQTLLADPEVQRLWKINRYADILWFNQEGFDELLFWLMMAALVDISVEDKDVPERLAGCHAVIKKLLEAKEESGYQVEKLLSGAQAVQAVK